MVWETRVQSQVKSYQRLKKWYLVQPCLTFFMNCCNCFQNCFIIDTNIEIFFFLFSQLLFAWLNYLCIFIHNFSTSSACSISWRSLKYKFTGLSSLYWYATLEVLLMGTTNCLKTWILDLFFGKYQDCLFFWRNVHPICIFCLYWEVKEHYY